MSQRNDYAISRHVILLANANHSMLMAIAHNYIFAYYKSQGKLMELNIIEIFGQNVQKYRKAIGLSQEQLADKAGLHRTYIGMIERAEKNVTLRNIQKLANALEVPMQHT